MDDNATDQTADETPQAETSTEPEAVEPPEVLGDAGKKALDSERTARKAADKQTKSLQQELDALKLSAMGEQEAAIETAKRDTRAEVEAEVASERVAAAAAVAAAGKLTHPEDLLRFVDATEMAGADAEQWTAKVDQLLVERPELGAGAKPGLPPVTQGIQPTGGPSQLSRADLKSMSPEQIEQARQDGKLSNLLAGKT